MEFRLGRSVATPGVPYPTTPLANKSEYAFAIRPAARSQSVVYGTLGISCLFPQRVG
jgi:hypothetical protein